MGVFYSRDLRTAREKDQFSSKWCKPHCALSESGMGRVLYFNKVTYAMRWNAKFLIDVIRPATIILKYFTNMKQIKPENAGNYICLGTDKYAESMSMIQVIVRKRKGIISYNDGNQQYEY